MSKLAILMRTKNSDWVIAQTLTALYSQIEVDFQLYIVDSGSTDSTLEICERFSYKPIKMKGNTYVPGPVLNAAISQITEEIIVLLNSDSVLLHPKSLKYLVAPLVENEQNIIATVGRQLPRHDAEPWVVKDYATCFPEADEMPNFMTMSFPLSAFKRSIWEQEKFYEKSWGSEDTEWGKRIVDKKYGSIKYVAKAITMHSHNYNNNELHNRKFIEGEADYFIYQTKPSLIKIALGYCKRVLSEIFYYVSHGHFFSVLTIFIRNFYYFSGYYRGLRSAKNREKKNISAVIHKPY